MNRKQEIQEKAKLAYELKESQKATLKIIDRAKLVGTLSDLPQKFDEKQYKSQNISKVLQNLNSKSIEKKPSRKARHLVSIPARFNFVLTSKEVVGSIMGFDKNNPVLYFQFENGRIKMTGAKVHTTNNFLTFQCTKNELNCQDSFQSVFLFTDIYWIGSKEENPEEKKLSFPTNMTELIEGNQVEEEPEAISNPFNEINEIISNSDEDGFYIPSSSKIFTSKSRSKRMDEDQKVSERKKIKLSQDSSSDSEIETIDTESSSNENERKGKRARSSRVK